MLSSAGSRLAAAMRRSPRLLFRRTLDSDIGLKGLQIDAGMANVNLVFSFIFTRIMGL